MRRIPAWLAIAAGAWTLVATPLLHAQEGNVVRVGVIGPFTGPSSDFGKPMLQGIELAVEEINAVGGYVGRPLQLVVKDSVATHRRV